MLLLDFNNLIIQWGKGVTSGNNNVKITLPMAYSNNTYNIQVTSVDEFRWDAINNWTYSQHSGSTINRTNTGFTISWNCGGRYWQTIGY